MLDNGTRETETCCKINTLFPLISNFWCRRILPATWLENPPMMFWFIELNGWLNSMIYWTQWSFELHDLLNSMIYWTQWSVELNDLLNSMIFWTQWSIDLDDLLIKNECLNNPVLHSSKRAIIVVMIPGAPHWQYSLLQGSGPGKSLWVWQGRKVQYSFTSGQVLLAM